MRRLVILIVLFVALTGRPARAEQYWDVIFPNDPGPAAKAIMVYCGEYSKWNSGAVTYWHCLVTETNYDHPDMPATRRDPDTPQARGLYEKPNPKGGDDIPTHTIGRKRMRSKASGDIHPLSLSASSATRKPKKEKKK